MLEKRQVYLEFLDKNVCVFTTPFRQKNHSLNDGDVIDLISLKKIEDYYPSFYGIVTTSDDGALIDVYAVESPLSSLSHWGSASMLAMRVGSDVQGGNNKLFKGTIWIEK